MKEESFGIIPIRYEKKQLELLLIQHRAGHWAFPKGHAEANETPQETAYRELFEELSLHVQELLVAPPFIENYSFVREGRTIEKQVTYFLALVEGNLRVDGNEVVDAKWVAVEEASLLATFPEAKRLIQRIKVSLK